MEQCPHDGQMCPSSDRAAVCGHLLTFCTGCLPELSGSHIHRLKVQNPTDTRGLVAAGDEHPVRLEHAGPQGTLVVL